MDDELGSVFKIMEKGLSFDNIISADYYCKEYLEYRKKLETITIDGGTCLDIPLIKVKVAKIDVLVKNIQKKLEKTKKMKERERELNEKYKQKELEKLEKFKFSDQLPYRNLPSTSNWTTLMDRHVFQSKHERKSGDGIPLSQAIHQHLKELIILLKNIIIIQSKINQNVNHHFPPSPNDNMMMIY
jgi:hypothetical protein